jgi:STE24 endopeptidase
MNIYLDFILIALVGCFFLESIARHVNDRALSTELPEEFRDVFDAREYGKSQKYARVCGRVSQVGASIDLTILLAVILFSGFNVVDVAARSFGYGTIGTGLIFFAIVGAARLLLGLPMSVYTTFVVEKRFGFNRTTPGLFVLDRIKSLVLNIAIMGPLLVAVLFLFEHSGSGDWLLVWGVVSLFVLGLRYIAPTWIMPLFNKFTPLPAGELRDSLERMAASQGIDLSDVFLMDGSKRSAKSNAFFTGFGKAKRIALYDTLVDKLNVAELTAVLAHEMGHWRLGHVRKMTAVVIFELGLLFFLMSLFLDTPEMFSAFGVGTPSVYAGLLFFLIMYTPVSQVLGVITNMMSRRHEFEADAYAARVCLDPEPLVSGLKKLSLANLSNLTPHPFFVVLYYSHPPVLQRIRALRAHRRLQTE